MAGICAWELGGVGGATTILEAFVVSIGCATFSIGVEMRWGSSETLWGSVLGRADAAFEGVCESVGAATRRRTGALGANFLPDLSRRCVSDVDAIVRIA